MAQLVVNSLCVDGWIAGSTLCNDYILATRHRYLMKFPRYIPDSLLVTSCRYFGKASL